MRRPLLGASLAVTLTAAACGGGGSPNAGGSSTARAAGPHGTLAWHSCQTHYQCATLAVPLNYADPRARTIDLALIRAPATDPSRRLGSLLINPGGPGESTVGEFSFLVDSLDATLRARFDIVGFDPRGVGYSTPVSCLAGPQLDAYFGLDLDPTTAAGKLALEKGSEAFAHGCEQRSGALLPYVGTVNAARDMNRIRIALGEPKLTYIGFSYGTYLGAEYAHEFPTEVRALDLDGALDPTLAPLDSDEIQAAGFQRDWDAFVQWCAAGHGCTWQPGGNREAALGRLMSRLTTAPLKVGTRLLGEGEASYGVAVTLYSMQSWPYLADALQEADQGDGRLLLELADDYTERSSSGTYSNLIEAEAAVDCRDSDWPTNPEAYFAAARASVRTAPDFGPENVLSSLVCAYFPVHASGPTPAPTAAGAPPILVVATTGDPATPYSEGLALTRELRVGRLLTRVGEGHTGYSSSACVRRYVDAYLVSLALPPTGTRCSS